MTNREVEAYPRTEDEPLYRQGWELPTKVRDYVPFYMRDIVCTCENSVGRYVDREIDHGLNEKKQLIKCRECDKYVRWVQRICKKCDVRFVLTFSHPRYVLQWPTCWECTQDENYDPWYEQVKEFPQSAIADSYSRGTFDDWPRYTNGNYTYPIVPPKPEDLIHKEKVTSLDLDNFDLDLESLF